jgi:hypothetical protein
MLYKYIMPEKKVINVKLVKGKRKATRKAKPKEKSRQKQKQRQVVNVQVSSGGSGGGGTSFIPMPQAPAFDYNLLASLIRPANTVDMPIREAAPIPEPVQLRPAEEIPLREASGKIGGGETEVKARMRKPGETDAQYGDRIARYEQQLANKSAKARQQTFERRKEEVLAKLPMGEATPVGGGGGATFVGEARSIFSGEK